MELVTKFAICSILMLLCDTEQCTHNILGRVYNSTLTFSARKKVAGYYFFRVSSQFYQLLMQITINRYCVH